jgi:hypothetical protein
LSSAQVRLGAQGKAAQAAGSRRNPLSAITVPVWAVVTMTTVTTTMRRWPWFLIAALAAVAIWSGWAGFGGMCGFGLVQPLPGIAPWHLNTAITLPVGVESYAAFALGAWLTSAVAEGARRFAKWSALGAIALGTTGQVAYHLLTSAHAVRAPVIVVVLVSCMPVVTFGMAVWLAHMLRSGAPASDIASATDTAKPEPPAELERPRPRPRPPDGRVVRRGPRPRRGAGYQAYPQGAEGRPAEGPAGRGYLETVAASSNGQEVMPRPPDLTAAEEPVTIEAAGSLLGTLMAARQLPGIEPVKEVLDLAPVKVHRLVGTPRVTALPGVGG